MKKLFLFILTLSILPISGRTATVSKDEALEKALSFLASQDNNATIELFSITGKSEMYKVVTKDGWCLLASDSNIKPILAYSRSDDFPEFEDMPDAMKWLFAYYEENIFYAKEHSDEINANAWGENSYEAYNAPSNRETVYLSRLGDVKWGQSKNNDGADPACEKIYNKFCPYFHSVSCSRTIVGCGAVALGQVLWYYQWPHWGLIPENMLNDSGLVSDEQKYKIYDWNLMPEVITSSTPMNQVDMIASFLKDCGYAESMEYGNGSSSTNVNKIATALINHFGYTSVQYFSRSDYPVNWVNRIKNEIRAGRPVIYRGGNDAGRGHFFVLHGFSGDYFNINWGWRGSYNHVMCTLDSLYYNVNAHYNNGQWAIINIQPNYPSCSPLVIPSSTIWNTNFVIQNGESISIGDRTITNGMQGVILSQESVTLTSGFKVEAGANVYIGIADMNCNDNGADTSSGEDIFNAYHAPQRQNTTYSNPSTTTKILRNDQILILREGKIFTITGQTVE